MDPLCTRMRRIVFLVFILVYSDIQQILRLPSAPIFAYSFLMTEINDPCTCSPPVLQRAYCESDFVIIGRYRNDMKNLTWTSLGLERIYKVNVQASLKGDLRFNKQYNIHFLENKPGCGWRSDSNYFLPKGRYLIAGRLWENRLLVTTCHWHEQVEKLTGLQIYSLFTDAYKITCPSSLNECEMSAVVSGPLHKCQYNYTMVECYSKFTVCTPQCSYTHQPQLDMILPRGILYPVATGLRRKLNKKMLLYNSEITKEFFQQCRRREMQNQMIHTV